MEKEEFKTTLKNAGGIIQDLVKKGNVTKILIKNNKKEVILHVPVTIAAVGALLSPLIAGVSVGLALVSECSIEIEKKSKDIEKKDD